MPSNAIYVCIDRSYEKYARACFNSLEKNYPNHPIVLVYANDLSDEFIQFINSLNNFKIVNYIKHYVNENLGPVNKEIVYNKYRLWTNEFDEYDRVLHLDADTLILRPLDDLFKEDFFIVDDYTEYSKLNMLIKCKEVSDMLTEDAISIDIDKQPPMGNAGVFVISKKYRNEEQYKKILYLTERYSKYLCFADQSVISMWCYINSICISKRITYNYQPPFFNFMPNRDMDTISIMHFTAKKPDQINFLLWGILPSYITQELVDLYTSYT